MDDNKVVTIGIVSAILLVAFGLCIMTFSDYQDNQLYKSIIENPDLTYEQKNGIDS